MQEYRFWFATLNKFMASWHTSLPHQRQDLPHRLSPQIHRLVMLGCGPLPHSDWVTCLSKPAEPDFVHDCTVKGSVKNSREVTARITMNSEPTKNPFQCEIRVNRVCIIQCIPKRITFSFHSAKITAKITSSHTIPGEKQWHREYLSFQVMRPWDESLAAFLLDRDYQVIILFFSNRRNPFAFMTEELGNNRS